MISQTPQQPPEPSQAQKTNSKAAKPYNHTNNPLPFQNPGSPQKTTLKTKPTNLRYPHTSHINTHPKPISQVPHQHTSEALLSSHISIHPKLFSQATSAYIRSSSLKSHQHTSEAHLSSPTKQSPKLRISINQSISQPIRPTIFFHNYNPKSSKNKFKYYTKTLQYIQTNLYSQIPSRQTAKNSPHPHPTQRRCHTISQHTTKKLSPCSHPAQH